MPDIRITCGTADSLFISTSSSATLHSPFFSLSLARCIIPAAGSRRQGGRRSQFADTILPAALRAAFSLPLPFFLSLIPSLVVYVRLYALVQVGLKSSLGVVRPAGRFAPGDTRRYIFPSVTMHRTSSKQRVWSTHRPVNIYVYVCVYITLVAVVYTTPGVPADIGETGKGKEIPGRYGPSRN